MTQLHRYEKGEGKDWNANDKIAWGKGDVHKDFQALQADLNEFSLLCGYDKLDVDGFLGARTVDAFQKVYAAVIARNPGLAATAFPPPKTKEDVAEYAQFIRQWLRTTATEVLAPAPAGG